MAPTPAASINPRFPALTLRPLRGQIMTCPPRTSFNVAGATPADNSDPTNTLIPDPACWTDCCKLEFDVNSSPTGAGDCAHAEPQNNSSVTPLRTVALRTADIKVDGPGVDDLGIAGLGIDRLTYSSCTKSYFSIATATPWSCAVLSTRTTLPAQ